MADVMFRLRFQYMYYSYQFYGSVDDRGRRTWDTKAYEQKAKYGHADREGLRKRSQL